MLKDPTREAWTRIDHVISSLPDLWQQVQSAQSHQSSRKQLDSPELARSIIRLRRKRDSDARGIFHDPAWDILLDLFAAAEENRYISISSACIASAVPPTTALRYISHLLEKGYISRYREGHDRRKVYVKITPKGRLIVSKFLESLASLFGFTLVTRAVDD